MHYDLHYYSALFVVQVALIWYILLFKEVDVEKPNSIVLIEEIRFPG